MAHYFATRYELVTELSADDVFSIVPDHTDDPDRGYPAYAFRSRRDVPLVAVCHQPYRRRLHAAQPLVFLARNAYDVSVSAYYYAAARQGRRERIREFLEQPRGALSAWITYMNEWAPHLLTHRDAAFVSYGRLQNDAGAALLTILDFLDVEPDPATIHASVAAAAALRQTRRILTGQEGTFWDHLQPEDIFLVQERVRLGLSAPARHLLESMGVELDPFPREHPD